MIQLSDINLHFGERILYDNLNWQVPDGARVALVGNNGTGKTTLFRVLMGDIEPDSGSVIIPKRSNISYLAQDISEALDPEMTLRRLFRTQEGHEFAARAGRVLKGLGFLTHAHVNDVLERAVAEFSGGWKMRLQLAKVLLSLEGTPSDLLLLDEPTNHLDTESLEWLEGWLLSFRGTLITIAHDVRFLNKLCPLTAELSQRKITVWRGNYSYYKEESRKRMELLAAQKKAQEDHIEKTEAFIERFRYKATKAAQVQSRIKALEKIDVIELDEAPPSANFRFPETSPSGHEVARADKVSKIYPQNSGDDICVFSNVSFSITRGQKAALVGANGSGKSTLSRIISLTEAPTSGSVKLGFGVKCAFYLQESVQNLDYSKTVMEEISQYGAMDAARKRDLLGAFLFRGDDIHKPIKVLSGGEKSRLALLKVLLQDSNFLILDEPTNHLDASTRQIFQRALLDYSGTILIVSHDRNFLDELADRVFEIREESLFDYPGNYSYFIEKRASQIKGEDYKNSENILTKTALRQQKKENAEKEAAKVKRKRELKELEDKIAVLEKELCHCDEMLCSPLPSSDIRELMLKRTRTEGKLEEHMKRWESLALIE